MKNYSFPLWSDRPIPDMSAHAGIFQPGDRVKHEFHGLGVVDWESHAKPGCYGVRFDSRAWILCSGSTLSFAPGSAEFTMPTKRYRILNGAQRHAATIEAATIEAARAAYRAYRGALGGRDGYGFTVLEHDRGIDLNPRAPEFSA